MKIYVFNGSPRKKCNTAQMLNAFVDGIKATAPDADVEYVNLFDYTYKPGMANYLKANEIYTIEDLESRVSTLKATVDELKNTMDTETARMKEMRKMPEYVSTLQELKPIVDGLQKIMFDKAKAKYKAEHEKELKLYYAARRRVLEMFPEGKYDGRILNKQYAELEQTHKETYAKFVAIREEYQRIWHIQSCVERGLGNIEQTQQKKDNRKQEER